jgi:TLD
MATLGLCSIPLPQMQHTMSASSTATPPSPRTTKNTASNKEEARRGLLKLVMTKFSSTPLQEAEYSQAEERMLRHQLEQGEDNPIVWRIQNEFNHDAALTVSERQYLSSLLLLGDANSIQSASATLSDEEIFPHPQQLEASGEKDDSADEVNSMKSNDTSTTSSTNSRPPHERVQLENEEEDEDGGILDPVTIEGVMIGRSPPPTVKQRKVQRDSLLQQQLFRVHETEDVPPSELLQRMQLAHQNSILSLNQASVATGTDDEEDVRTSCFSRESSLRFRSTSPTIQEEPADLFAGADQGELFACEKDEVVLLETATVPSTTIPSSDGSQGGSGWEQQASSTVDVVNANSAIEQGSAENVDDAALSWNPFDDISSWLDGSQGVEVTGAEAIDPGQDNQATTRRDSITMVRSATMSTNHHPAAPFRIIGTCADDISCHPHVLSPPLMESLLAFVPEYTSATLSSTSSTSSSSHGGATGTNSGTNAHGVDETRSGDDEQVFRDETAKAMDNIGNPVPSIPPAASSYNFWLKYSLVRDGPSLWTFLRQVRASTLCFLAIETDEGHVFGAFTSMPWRLSKGWYGSKDTFLWKMRRSRLETAGKSILQQVCQESEIQVYPYRTGNAAVQYCSKKCLMLGQGEIIPSPRLHNPDKPVRPKTGSKHYGYALYLDKDLTSGTTSSSETFGNPCLIDPDERGARFYVSNIEVWTLTSHDTVAEAEQSELSNLFLDGGRDNAHRLNFMNILVGGPI